MVINVIRFYLPELSKLSVGFPLRIIDVGLEHLGVNLFHSSVNTLTQNHFQLNFKDPGTFFKNNLFMIESSFSLDPRDGGKGLS